MCAELTVASIDFPSVDGRLVRTAHQSRAGQGRLLASQLVEDVGDSLVRSLRPV